MIRFALKIGLMLLAAILIYNYFRGTEAEKENSRKVFGELKDVVVSVGALVKSEKAKFDQGKYDKALEQLGGAYKSLSRGVKNLDAKFIQRLDELEQRRARLKQELDSIGQGDQEAAAAPKKGLKKDKKADEAKAAKAADLQRRKEELQRELDQLLRDSDALSNQAQAQE